MSAPRLTQDDQRANFLLALDRSDKVRLHGFELDFVATNLERFSFSTKQRVIIDKLMEKYEIVIGWNPNDTRKAARQIHEQAAQNRNSPAAFTARARPPRKTEHIKEALKCKEGRYKLDRAPIKPGSVVRNGTRLEDWFVNYATGDIQCPFVQPGDIVEYDAYSTLHG